MADTDELAQRPPTRLMPKIAKTYCWDTGTGAGVCPLVRSAVLYLLPSSHVVTVALSAVSEVILVSNMRSVPTGTRFFWEKLRRTLLRVVRAFPVTYSVVVPT